MSTKTGDEEVFVYFDGLRMPVEEWLKTRGEDISTHLVLHEGRVLQNGEEIYIGWTVKVRPRKIVSAA